MNPQQIIDKVTTALDVLSRTARDHDGLFPSLLDLNTYQHPDPTPTAIEGQREHDLDNQIFVAACDSDSYDVTSTYVVWGSQYGQNAPVAGNALLCLRAHEFRPDPRLIKFARAAGTTYQNNLTPPSETNVPVKDAGLALELLTELYAVTEETTWLDAANELADTTLPLFFPRDLPYAASGRPYYESQLIPGYYLHGLARTALMTEDGPKGGLKADFTQR